MKNTDIQNNPLIADSPLQHHAVPFDKIQPEHYLPALDWAIAKAQQRIEIIKTSAEPATFENTVLALETASDEVDYVSTVFYNLHSAHATEEVQALAKEVGPKLSEFSSDISLNPELFARVKAVYDQKNSLKLNAEQTRLLEDSYEGFTRNGALLPEDKKEQLRQIDKEMSVITPAFSENVLKATNAFELWISDEKDLDGLPESAIAGAKKLATDKGKADQWLFNLQMPSLIPFMTYCKNRELRKTMSMASGSRAFQGEFDNQDNIKKIISYRAERAKLLGFKTHADFVLKKRMAETPEKVIEFLSRLIDKSLPAAKKEMAELEAFAKDKDGIDQLMGWDVNYYVEKLKQEKFSFDEEELRPYFKLENVIDGAFLHAKKLYDIRFETTDKYPVYHEDVKVYEVYRESSNEYVGLFYADFFPRDTKRSGAWMTNYIDQGLFKGEVIRPHVGIVCNFTPSTADRPSLLTFNEVRTLFHEFGHALHGMLSQCTYRSLSGTSVYWDFVELPSQILENWTLEKEALDLFAHHYETGESIPKDMTDKIKASSQFMAGYYSIRQLTFGTVDMAWHNHADPKSIEDVSAFEQKVVDPLRLVPKAEGTNLSCAFSHIFAGGYSAGYYSYKWAEVLDADAFELFQEKGIFNKDVADSFHDHILSRGGTEHPMELYKKFRGREPDPDALLRRDGLI
tara:strand:+ start:82450 stop:84504 length:2055 start_codon:yes stop_codon:yes gene_type:complete